MSKSVSIFCKDHNKINFSEIIEFIKDGCYFEEEPNFIDTTESRVIIQYDLNLRPIIIESIIDLKVVEQMKYEICEHITLETRKSKSACNEDLKNTILSGVVASKMIILFDFSDGELSEDCWDMMASTEAFIAKKNSGLIIAEEGIYNSDLKIIVTF